MTINQKIIGILRFSTLENWRFQLQELSEKFMLITRHIGPVVNRGTCLLPMRHPCGEPQQLHVVLPEPEVLVKKTLEVSGLDYITR